MFEAGAECGGIRCDFLVLVSIKWMEANDVRCVCVCASWACGDTYLLYLARIGGNLNVLAWAPQL